MVVGFTIAYASGTTTKLVCTPVSSTNTTDSYDIAKLLLKVALNTISPFSY